MTNAVCVYLDEWIFTTRSNCDCAQRLCKHITVRWFEMALLIK